VTAVNRFRCSSLGRSGVPGSQNRTLLPLDTRAWVEVLQWLFWQMGGLGPMAGQKPPFHHTHSEKLDYAIDRYVNETSRLLCGAG